MASDDPHTGGDLFDMAATGTKIPGDAGKMNIIPSVPRPDQIEGDPNFAKEGLGAPDTASAADNATDIPRRNQDVGATGEVITGTGDQLPAVVESKRLHVGAGDPRAKGHDRYEKHARQNESEIERLQGQGPDVEAAPGEERDTQDQIRERKDGKDV